MEAAHENAGQTSVARIQEAVEVAGAPTNLEDETSVQGHGDCLDCVKRRSVAMPAFNQGHRCLRDIGGRGKVALAPPAATPKRTNPKPETCEVHVGTIADGPYLWLIGTGPTAPARRSPGRAGS